MLIKLTDTKTFEEKIINTKDRVQLGKLNPHEHLMIDMVATHGTIQVGTTCGEEI